MAQRVVCQIQVAEVLGFTTHWDNILLIDFLFSRRKASHTNRVFL